MNNQQQEENDDADKTHDNNDFIDTIDNLNINQSLGYTPLTEIHSNTSTTTPTMMMMVSEATGITRSNQDDNDDNNDKMFSMGPPPLPQSLFQNICNNNDEWDFDDYQNTNEEGNDDNDYQGGAFYTHLNNFTISSNDNNDNVNDDYDDIDKNEQDNYKVIAEQALQNLLRDYNETITSVRSIQEEDHSHNQYERIAEEEDDDDDEKEKIVIEENQLDLINNNVNTNDIQNECDHQEVTINITNNQIIEEFQVNFDEINPSSISSQSNNTTTTTTYDKNINVNKDAITKAMTNIRLKASTTLITKLDEGVKQGTIKTIYPIVNVPTEHPIIPSKQLLAFRRSNTLKSIDATSKLTRSATLADGVAQFVEWIGVCKEQKQKQHQHQPNNEQLSLLSSFDKERKNSHDTFVIHIIGADNVECKSKETIQQAIGPFVQWWDKVTTTITTGMTSNNQQSPVQTFISSFQHLRIEFLGPNISHEAHLRQPVLLFPTPTSNKKSCTNKNVNKKGLQTATAICRNCLYHDYLETIKKNDSIDNDDNNSDGANSNYSFPHIMIAYNAGIWGYDDWIPTLKSMNTILPHPTPFIITSYTLHEAEDDAEVVRDVFMEWEKDIACGNNKNVQDFVVVTPVTNPFGSRKVRETKTSPNARPYFENGAWQLWVMGGRGL